MDFLNPLVLHSHSAGLGGVSRKLLETSERIL